MRIKEERIYINGLLEPLKSEKSEFNKKFTMYPHRMMPINEISQSYHVDINGLEERGDNNNKLDMLAQVDLFDNRISSENITDLFSMLYYSAEDNMTTYTHYSTIKKLHFCPNELGLLDLRERYTPVVLQNISTKLYISIYKKQINLFNILSH